MFCEIERERESGRKGERGGGRSVHRLNTAFPSNRNRSIAFNRPLDWLNRFRFRWFRRLRPARPKFDYSRTLLCHNRITRGRMEHIVFVTAPADFYGRFCTYIARARNWSARHGARFDGSRAPRDKWQLNQRYLSHAGMGKAAVSDPTFTRRDEGVRTEK